jgi:S-DNA-T family DNA segregation ATPase FtsK/SpoIIIE
VKILARRKRKSKNKSKSLTSSLKFELYGILMLIFSAIALFRAGSVGRSMTVLFRFLIGVLDWILPLVVIYIALFVMINRSWPRRWTNRKSGILLLVMAWILLNEMSFIHQVDTAKQAVTPAFIVNSTWDSLLEGLRSAGTDGDILTRQVGGGLTGSILYACLYFLFSYDGTVIVEIALFALGIMLFTGISFVDVGKSIKARLDKLRAGFRAWLREMYTKKESGGEAGASMKSKRKKHYIDEDDADLEEEPELPSVRKKAPMLINLIPSNKKKPPLPEQDRVRPVADDEHLVRPESGEPESEAIPFIRDFQDHIDPVIEPEPALAATATDQAHSSHEGEQADGEFNIAKVRPPAKPYKLPSFQLLNKPIGGGKGTEAADFKANARKLEATMESFGVRAKVLEVVRGPAVTRYEIQPDVGVKVSRIVGLTDDIALALAAKDIRMEAPIPGKSAIGIEVPNTEVSIVTLREVMETSAFLDSQAKLSITLGRDISGQPIVGNLAKMPHVLVAGATGSGKSVCINGIITSILYKAKPDEVKFLMVDPKMVELNVYNGIPHLLAPVVTDPRRASLALKKIVLEMEKRYELFSKSGTRNIEGYNTMITDPNHPTPGDPLPLIVVIVDELADLMMVAANDVEDSITRLAQMARAAGIHLIIATQRPSVDVITGVIKANIPSRIAFGVSSQVDSRTILDMVGAEKLLGRGDMLYLPVGASKPVRVQGAFLSDQEVEAVVNYCRNQEQANYQEDLVPMVEEQQDAADTFEDELYDQAVQIVLEAKQASVSLLQRRMRVGYTRAARLIDSMEAKGIVGPYEGSKPREVLITLEQFHHSRISS